MKPDNNRHIDFDHEDESEHSVDSSNEHEDNFKPANKNRRIDFDHEDESEHSVDSSNEHEDNFKTEITNHGINSLPIDSISKVPEENVLHGID